MVLYNRDMGFEPIEQSERNQALYKDYKRGMGTVELITKYKVSNTRIYQIIKKIEAKLKNEAKSTT